MNSHPAVGIVKMISAETNANSYNANEAIPTIKNVIRSAARNEGLHVEINKKRTYFYKDGVLIGGLIGNRSSAISPETVKTCRQKYLTFKVLTGKRVPVSKGKIFDNTEYDAAQRWVRELGKSVVVKPASFQGGKGVTVNVDISFFLDAWKYCVETLEQHNKKDMDIIVETYHPGVDIRAIVIGDRFICATSRLPANVIGDGKSDIRTLIEIKNSCKAKNPFLKSKMIKIDTYSESLLRSQGICLDWVPNESEVVILDEVSNLNRGGEPVDVTDIICDDLKTLAIKAAQAFPDLDYAGIDIITPTFDSAKKAVVNEVNNYNNIMMHYYPMFGKPRDPASALIKYFMDKHENLKNHPTDDLLAEADKAMEQNNNAQAIILLQHAMAHYSKPPVKLFVRLARLYQADNYPAKAREFMLEAMANCQGDDTRDMIRDVMEMQFHVQEQTDRLEEKLNVRRKRIRQARNRIARREKQITRLKQRNKDLRAKVKELNSIKRSRFWRYYRGLRKLLRLFKPVRPVG